VLIYDRREIVDEFLLPTSEMHWVLISKEWMAAQSAGQYQRNLTWARGSLYVVTADEMKIQAAFSAVLEMC